MSRKRFSTYLALLVAGLCAGCRSSSSGEVFGLLVSTSWVDRGLKCLVLEEGTAYTYRQQTNQFEFFSFRVPPQDREKMGVAFRANGFFSLPRRLWAHVTDGTEERLLFADPQREYHVLRYMQPSPGFSAIVDTITQTIARDQLTAKSLTPEQALGALAQRYPAGETTPQARAVHLWMDFAARDVRSRGGHERELSPYLMPGGDSAWQ